MRWVQLGAASPVMRTQANGVAVPAKDRPQVIDPDQIDNWRRYTKLHTQLYPYLTAALKKYRRSGLPPMRHLALAYPKDGQAAAREDEFLLPPKLTQGRDKIRFRCEFVPVGIPLFPGDPPQEEAWTEFRYWAYCFAMPGTNE